MYQYMRQRTASTSFTFFCLFPVFRSCLTRSPTLPFLGVSRWCDGSWTSCLFPSSYTSLCCSGAEGLRFYAVAHCVFWFCLCVCVCFPFFFYFCFYLSCFFLFVSWLCVWMNLRGQYYLHSSLNIFFVCVSLCE